MSLVSVSSLASSVTCDIESRAQVSEIFPQQVSNILNNFASLSALQSQLLASTQVGRIAEKDEPLC